ncbi:MAG: S8 family serine peptidase, partial [Planctomycetota bacterium]
FSSWGPTDDGRIKPDIVANGQTLRSSIHTGDAAYGYASGTSMSTPSASGSINLLVRYFEATHDGLTPLSSTIKALLMHTADEAGPDPGPDYMFGWGLMNTLKAAELILRDSVETRLIHEKALADGELHEYELESDGIEAIRIALAWTDPPGTSPPVSLNPANLMLVNDLDLRLEHQTTAAVYEPYILDPANPANAATTGDNFRDNCELIYLEAPPAGTYIVTVSHKGTLATPQYYSLVGAQRLVDCDCTNFCDLDLNNAIDPLDVAILVAYVYQQLDAREQLLGCPLENGNWDCVGAVDPVDVAFYVAYVYQQVGDGPCDPCTFVAF